MFHQNCISYSYPAEYTLYGFQFYSKYNNNNNVSLFIHNNSESFGECGNNKKCEEKSFLLLGIYICNVCTLCSNIYLHTYTIHSTA